MATNAATPEAAPAWTLRFGPVERTLHACLFTSFLGLALTGLPLLFSEAPWARTLSGLFGGYGVTGNLHRFFGWTMIVTFVVHVARLVYRLYGRKELRILWGPDSLVPQPRDIAQLAQHFRWFVGLGPRPRFDRYTYWEKFDYWAVFWGMAVIGSSGLMLAYPGFFSLFLPGWLFNLALVVHGEEALLAMVFIFTVHFFNGNLRPEKFPMDTVMFTGRESLEELKHERPAYFERLEAEGRLAAVAATPPPARLKRLGYVAGSIAISLGLVMVFLTLYAITTAH
jgi:cytochrome b subunit of formate dehydrogenase